VIGAEYSEYSALYILELIMIRLQVGILSARHITVYDISVIIVHMCTFNMYF